MLLLTSKFAALASP